MEGLWGIIDFVALKECMWNSGYRGKEIRIKSFYYTSTQSCGEGVTARIVRYMPSS